MCLPDLRQKNERPLRKTKASPKNPKKTKGKGPQPSQGRGRMRASLHRIALVIVGQVEVREEIAAIDGLDLLLVRSEDAFDLAQ